MTEKFEKLHSRVSKFMADFQSSADQNTKAGNEIITSLGATLQTEKEALSHVRGELKADNSNMNASIVSKI